MSLATHGPDPLAGAAAGRGRERTSLATVYRRPRQREAVGPAGSRCSPVDSIPRVPPVGRRRRRRLRRGRHRGRDRLRWRCRRGTAKQPRRLLVADRALPVSDSGPGSSRTPATGVGHSLPAPYQARQEPCDINPRGLVVGARKPVEQQGLATAAWPHQRYVVRRSHVAEQVRQALGQYPRLSLAPGQRQRNDARPGSEQSLRRLHDTHSTGWAGFHRQPPNQVA